MPNPAPGTVQMWWKQKAESASVAESSISELVEQLEQTRAISQTPAPLNLGIDECRVGLGHIEIEKWLERQYPLEVTCISELKITLLSKGSGGFGDVIWGVRALEALMGAFPNSRVVIITDVKDKFEQLDVSGVGEGSIGCIDNKDTAAIEATTECDLALDGPYLGIALVGKNDVPLKKLVGERRLLSGIEYDCTRDYSEWYKVKSTDKFISGVGDNAYGIFIVDELSTFQAKHSDGLSVPEKVALCSELKCQATNETLEQIFTQGAKKIYLAYGYDRKLDFINIIAQFEDVKASDDVIIVVLTSDALNDDEITKIFDAAQLENIASVYQWTQRHRLSEQEMADIASKYSSRTDIETLRQKQPVCPAGQDYVISKKELKRLSANGRNIHIVRPDGLTHHDTMILHKVSESITMMTGDQSFSEAISMRKQVLYDPRKEDTINWLKLFAERNKLHLVAEMFGLFSSVSKLSPANHKRIVEILRDPEFRQQNEMLVSICHQRNFALALVQKVSRRIFQLRTNFTSERAEKEIHKRGEEFVQKGTGRAQLEESVAELRRIIAEGCEETRAFDSDAADKVEETPRPGAKG